MRVYTIAVRLLNRYLMRTYIIARMRRVYIIAVRVLNSSAMRVYIIVVRMLNCYAVRVDVMAVHIFNSINLQLMKKKVHHYSYVMITSSVMPDADISLLIAHDLKDVGTHSCQECKKKYSRYQNPTIRIFR